jgi:glycosyltransferase involved in cell wall biosynthesis
MKDSIHYDLRLKCKKRLSSLRLVIIIPAFNEEVTIGEVIRQIPRNVTEDVKVLVIDDGSTDNTADKARRAGADKTVSFIRNRGLAIAFKKGLAVAIEMGADIIVNIDADGQYDPQEIAALVKPVVEGEADIVLGSRFKGWIEYMPKRNRLGNALATQVTSFLSGLRISDAQTGFRALSREAALRLNIISNYTYTQEMIIQAAQKGLTIIEIPCAFRARPKGESRLISNIFSYARRAGLTTLMTYRDYKPLRIFLLVGGLLCLAGLVVGIRVLIHFVQTGMVTPYLPSAILASVLIIIGFQIAILGLIADMIGNNRRLIEEILYDLRKDKSIQNT